MLRARREPNRPQRLGRYRVQSRSEAQIRHPRWRRIRSPRWRSRCACDARRPAHRRRRRGNRRRAAGGRSAERRATLRSTARACGSGTSTGPTAAASRRSSPAPSASGIGTVYVKAGDGGDVWSQFSRVARRALCTRGGLDVCAWQFVYGDDPVGRGQGRRRGGGQGRRLPGDRRRGRLRGQVRLRRPLHPRAASADRRRPSRSPSPPSLTSTTTRRSPTRSSSARAAPPTTSRRCTGRRSGPRSRGVYEHTYLYNRLWDHPIYPLGQTYEAPGTSSLKLFRRFAASYGGLQPSWWDWQETSRQRVGGAGADQRRAARSPATARASSTRC